VSVDKLELIFEILLVILALYDFRYMKIPVVVAIFELIIGIINLCIKSDETSLIVEMVIIECVFGLLICKVGLMGIGDGIILVAVTLMHAPMISLRIYLFAFWFSALVSLLIIIIKGKKKNMYIPFIPIIAIAEVLVVYI